MKLNFLTDQDEERNSEHDTQWYEVLSDSNSK